MERTVRLTPVDFKKTVHHRYRAMVRCTTTIHLIEELPKNVRVTSMVVRQRRFAGPSVQVFFDDGSSVLL